jgi:hypothetical protein
MIWCWRDTDEDDMKLTLATRLALMTFAASATAANAVDRGEPVVVHVKEVHRTEDASTEKGTWYHIRAVGESATVVYTLKCSEYLNVKLPKPDFTLRCYALSAGKEYKAFKFPRALNFWQPEDKSTTGTLALYDIVDEKEK